jgi:hypothetical protein
VSPRAEDVLQDFQAHCEGVTGVQVVRLDSYEDEPCLVVIVDAEFDRASLPIGFMGFPVMLDDGSQSYPAEGPLVLREEADDLEDRQ